MMKSLSGFEQNLMVRLITPDEVNRHFLQCDMGGQSSDRAAPSMDAHRNYMSVRLA